MSKPPLDAQALLDAAETTGPYAVYEETLSLSDAGVARNGDGSRGVLPPRVARALGTATDDAQLKSPYPVVATCSSAYYAPSTWVHIEPGNAALLAASWDLARELVRLRAEYDAFRRRVERTPPWEVSPVPTDEDMYALRLRWANGPERYQADADALIAAILDLRAQLAAGNAAPDPPRTPVEGNAVVPLRAWMVTDDYDDEGHCQILFAPEEAEALCEAAAHLGRVSVPEEGEGAPVYDLHGLDAHPKPHWDRFAAQGFVPLSAFLTDGWMECAGCSEKCPVEGEDFVVTHEGGPGHWGTVFHNALCKAREDARKAAQKHLDARQTNAARLRVPDLREVHLLRNDHGTARITHADGTETHELLPVVRCDACGAVMRADAAYDDARTAFVPALACPGRTCVIARVAIDPDEIDEMARPGVYVTGRVLAVDGARVKLHLIGLADDVSEAWVRRPTGLPPEADGGTPWVGRIDPHIGTFVDLDRASSYALREVVFQAVPRAADGEELVARVKGTT